MDAVTFQTEPTGAEAPVTTPQRPENVPEKFWDAKTGAVNTEALLASYTALEGKLGAPKTETPAETTTETPAETKTETPPAASEAEVDEAEEVAKSAGIDVEALQTHWAEKGEIPAEDYAKLEAVGIGKDMVDDYIKYRVGQGAALRNEMLAPYGGEEGVDALTTWAGENWTQEQATAFNDAVNSKDRGRMEIALKGLKADYDKAKGVPPKLLNGGGNQPPVRGDSYQSLAQFLADQRDPRYATDPAFRDGVIAKLGRSNI